MAVRSVFKSVTINTYWQVFFNEVKLYYRISSRGAMPCFHNLTTMTMDEAAPIFINTELFSFVLSFLPCK